MPPGRYVHEADQHDAPLDPNFSAPAAASPTGRRYRFHDQARRLPLAQPPNAWRPNHIHFSLFGPSLTTRLVTQMYLPGDPLLDLDPIYQSAPKARASA